MAWCVTVWQVSVTVLLGLVIMAGWLLLALLWTWTLSGSEFSSVMLHLVVTCLLLLVLKTRLMRLYPE